MNKYLTSSLVVIVALTLVSSVFAVESKVTAQALSPVTKIRMIDINRATEEQLKSLPGVEAESAKNIIAGRPYHDKSELKSKNVISTDIYEKINKLVRSLC